MNHFKSLLAGAVLVLASLGAQAASVSYKFSGVTDDLPPVALAPFSGSFSFEAVDAGFTGSAALTAFSLDFQGELYGLVDSDAPALAWFDNGLFLGVDFLDFDDASRTSVGLTAGSFDPSDAFFSYLTLEGRAGYGSVSFEPQAAVPLPGSAGLALAAFLGVAAARRKAFR